MEDKMKKEIKNLLKEKKIWLQKGLGQNFLISKRVLEKIIKASQLKKTDIVLEIGPGIGTLTKELAKRVKKVITVEKDSRLIEILKEIFKDFQNVEILNEDILKIENEKSCLLARQVKIENYKVVANLPYYITAPVIQKFLETESPPKLMVLMVQKEVGQRICAQPPKMSKLAVFSQFYGRPEIISYVSKKSFWPQSKVDSAILKIVPRKFFSQEFQTGQTEYFSLQFRKQFAEIIKAGFSQPRKQLINNLSQKLNLSRKKVESWLSKNKIESQQRAETLRVTDWINLTKTFNLTT